MSEIPLPEYFEDLKQQHKEMLRQQMAELEVVKALVHDLRPRKIGQFVIGAMFGALMTLFTVLYWLF